MKLETIGVLAPGGAGVLLFTATVADWDWFMEGSKNREFVDLFGRQPTRIVIACVGLAAASMGFGYLTGLIDNADLEFQGRPPIRR